MATTVWDPQVYEQFADLRARPYHDLVGMLHDPGPAPTVVDLGCGTGALTSTLAHRFADAAVLGIDSSPEMLAETSTYSSDRVRFEPGDIESFERPDTFDIVLSNAALHWTDDHAATLGRWARSLAPGGQLAVQLPANYGHPSHTVAEAVTRDAWFAGRWTTGGPPADRGERVLQPGDYAQILHDLGFAEQRVQLIVYPMVLDSSAAVLDWVRGTLLAPYRSNLAPEDYAEFERRYAERLAAEIGGPTGEQRPYFYGFERILMWGRRGR